MGAATAILEAVGRALAPAMSKLFLRRGGLFESFQKQGVHVVPNHFYSPVPDTRTINPKLFDEPSHLPAIDLRLPAQLELMRSLRARYGAEFDAFRSEPSASPAPPGEFSFRNVMFGPIDAEILYGLVRTHKPARIIEIGSGHSTRLAAAAALANQREDPSARCELVCIEPYASEELKRGFPGLSRLITERVENVPISLFEGLKPNDILFIDSSHVLKIGSDVQYEFLEILPRVGVGALVHVHDIFFPFDYPRTWVMQQRRFWTEQYLLQTFLMFNNAFETIWCSTAAEHAFPRDIAECFPSAARERAKPGGIWHDRTVSVGPTSFWMRRTR